MMVKNGGLCVQTGILINYVVSIMHKEFNITGDDQISGYDVSLTINFSLSGDDGNTDWAVVLCNELGYSGVDEIKFITESSIPQGTGNITFMNPDCNIETTSTMQVHQ